ncbi:iron-containing alcohol dehydrogenase [Anaeromicrobium sediminis]|uniref:NADH-dependent alcohol dehydrogenase n=1 Tax=Anaeromicrobium sediminis TaxID=1478221 RepID=A0A267MMY6_9FIRM|nr:iron-containing alcohol dehydrogenase [Anaeromicrobium sediminis]PAB60183.1 NADH-dependent alcohol dehydrogenase [Anaeromicrobium sediminis]
MNSFYYYNPTKLVFGKDSVSKMGNYIPKDVKKILLHYGKDSIKRSGLYDEVIEILKNNKIEVIELSGVEPNPKVSLVREGVKICKDNNIDFILAVGGGSVIDSAKAISAGVYYEKDVWELFTEGIELKRALPLGVILTLPATGSESSSATIVTNEETLQKLGLESDLLRPKFALLNPELTLTLPNKQTFAGIVDILSHVMERYFTNTTDVELTDNLCEGTMRAVISNAYKLLDNPNDYGARAEIMLSGTIAHSGILGLGREEDWASHRIGHEITALYGTTHGVTLSIVLPAWMKYVYKENIDRFVRFAKFVFHVDSNDKTNEEIALLGIEKFEGFLKDIKIPIRLKEEGIPYDDFNTMAEKCTGSGSIGRFVKLSKEDVVKILEMAK